MNSHELVPTVRSVLGQGYKDADIIRALQMANNDTTRAINIILDTPSFTSGNGRSPMAIRDHTESHIMSGGVQQASSTVADGSRGSDDRSDLSIGHQKKYRSLIDEWEEEQKAKNWWFVGYGDLPGMSTSKGRRIKAGEEVFFTFPSTNNSVGPTASKVFGRGRRVAACSEIVRFSSKRSGEIGRIPNEWSQCLLPLVRDRTIRIEGFCRYAPEVLGILDTIFLSVSVYISASILKKRPQSLLKPSGNNEESVVHPLPALFRMLGLTPFQKAEFTPDTLHTRKRPLDSKDIMGLHTSVLPSSLTGNKTEKEEAVSDGDIDNIVGVENKSELEEMDPPSTLLCDLRPYQKQALHFMFNLERRGRIEEAAKSLHPCWEAYRLADKRGLVVYLNAFSGEVTAEFPSTFKMARGGILADAMGLGKTIMTISLLLTHVEPGVSPNGQLTSQSSRGNSEMNDVLDAIPENIRATQSRGAAVKFMNKKDLISGRNLIICPMTLLGQWKAEIESHVQPGSVSIYVHYGPGRTQDVKLLAQSDVVLTTYGVLASDFSSGSAKDNGGLYSVHWFRVVLDEAHTIKSSKSQVSSAATALTADCRWCLTGTPIQNNLEDVFSLLRFLRIEPWGNWAWWNKLVQKPFEEGDERGLKLVQSILRPIMLRRTKHSVDREGRPILVLPPASIQVVYCELTEAENDFYEALFKKSKVKFDRFVAQGRVLHNYASILELLLRLRQCCDHPFLVMSRGDTQEFADLNKLAKRFLKGGQQGATITEGETQKDAPSKAFIQEVVEELKKGEQVECPICLEVCEDAVLTPCAHRLCRECLLASWRNHTSGICPVCRKTVCKQELITAPTGSRFQVDVKKNWVESTKVSALMRELEALRESGSKSIVFSQWTAFLDLLQIPLSRKKISFVRLDGTLSQQQREKVLKQFSEDSHIMVLLMSLKAGGVGINLTAASNAFVMDPWWNPAVEEQAVMRIHRIGQTKSVMIKRFIVKGTVEERMEAVQARKQRMISGALTDQEVRSARIEELKMLFT